MALTKISSAGIQTSPSFSGSSTFTGNVNITGVTTFADDLIISSSLPRITLNDTNHESDFDIKNENGSFRIRDLDNPTDRYRINSSGTIHEFFGAADFNSNLTVDGTLNANQLNFGDSNGSSTNIALFGDSNDLKIYHNGSHSIVQETGSGGLLLLGSVVEIGVPSGSEKYFRAVQNGAAELYHNNVKRLETSSVGVSIPENLDVDGQTDLDDVSISGITTVSSQINFGGGTTQLQISNSNDSDINHNESNGSGLRFRINGQTQMVVKTDSISFASNLQHLYTDLIATHSGDTNTRIRFPSDDTFSVETGGSERLRIHNTGLNVTGVATFSASAHISNANGSLFFGAGNETAYGSQGGIGRASTNGFHIADSLVGDLCIGAEGSKRIIFGTKTSTGIGGLLKRVQINADGSAQFHSNLRTTNLKVNSTNAQVDLTSGQASFTRYAAINHFHNNSTSTIHNQIKLAPRNGSTGRIMFSNLIGGTLTERLRIDGTDGIQPITHVIPMNDSSYNLGNISNRWLGVYSDALDVAGDVTISGTLTYEDVTNIDSIGIVTARSGVRVNADGSSSSNYISAGASDDLKIYHNGSDSYITDTGTGDLKIGGATRVDIGNSDLSKLYFRGTNGGGANLYHNNSLKIGTYDSGLNVYGDVTLNDSIIHRDDTNTKIRFPANDTFTVETAGSERFRIKSDGKIGIGVNATNPSFQLQIHESDSTAYAANATVAQLAVGNVNSSSATNAAGIQLFTDGNGRGLVNLSALNNHLNSSADFAIQTRHSATTAERLRIKSSGIVGIGTTNPIAQLDVNVGSSVNALNIEGSEGQLFSVTNNLSSGSIFAVNDITGLPSIDVNADGTIQLAPRGAGELVGIGTTSPTSKLHVVGDTLTTGFSTFRNKVQIKPLTAQTTCLTVGCNDAVRLTYTSANQSYLQSSAHFLSIANNNVIIQRYDTNCTMATFRAGAENSFTWNYVKRLSTSSIGATVFGQLDTTDLNVAGVSTFSDVIVGSGKSIQLPLSSNTTSSPGAIYFGDTFVQGTEGARIYQNTSQNTSFEFYRLFLSGDRFSVKASNGTTAMIEAYPSASLGVSLYNAGSKKLQTTSIGAQIDTTLLLYGAAGNPGRLRLQEGGALSEIMVARNSDNNSFLYFKTEIAGTTATRVMIDESGHFRPNVDSTNDLGINGTRWRNVYADTYYGNGSNLTGITASSLNISSFSADSNKNIFSGGTCSGCNLKTDGDTHTNGCHNIMLGACAGKSMACGDFNVLIGENAGCSLVQGTFGCNALANVFIGRGPGKSAEHGCFSVAIGCGTLESMKGFGCNIAFGRKAGQYTCTGTHNFFAGNYAAKYNCNGQSNIAIGERSISCNTSTTGNNIALGLQAMVGSSTTTNNTGGNNVAIGQYAGRCLTSGANNVFLKSATSGCISGNYNFIVHGGTNFTSGLNNVIFGELAAHKCAVTGSRNFIVGSCAGCAISSGSCNIIFGSNAARTGVLTGSDNIIIGSQAAYAHMSNASCNIIFGRDTAVCLATGQQNIAIGARAGYHLDSGAHNIFIGENAGAYITPVTSGTGNIAIGNDVDVPSPTGDDQLAIGCNNCRWITGNSSFNVTLSGIATVYAATGIVSATSFFGDGSNLTGVGGVAVQSGAPSSANVGDLWYDTDDGRIFVYYNDGNSAQWVDASPNGTPTDLVIEGDLTPATDNSSDLGASNKRWANVYSADLQLSNVGTGGNEVDRSEGSWTIQEGEEDLFLINRRNGKKYKFNLTEVS